MIPFNLEPIEGGGGQTPSTTIGNTFKIFINGVEFTNFINYPVSFIDKNLDESFNSYTITLDRMVEFNPFVSNIPCKVEWYVEGILEKEFYTILVSDAVEKIGNTNLYKHNLNLIEYAYYLDMVTLPDMTITRVEGIYEPTLKEVAERILNLAGWELKNGPLGIELDSTTANLLNETISPEWTFTRMTALEALKMVFGYIKIVPYATSFTLLGHVAALFDSEDESLFNEFGSISAAYNPATYRTRIESNVSNFIAEGGFDSSVVEPANGWITPRSPDGFEISNDNAIIPTSKPIYNIQKLEVQPISYTIRYMHSGGLTATENFTLSQLPTQDWVQGVDISDVLFEKDVYDTLENTEVYGERGGALFYNQGENSIQGLTYRSPTNWSWSPNKQAIRVISDGDTVVNGQRHHPAVKGIKPQYWNDFTTWIATQTAFPVESV